VTDLARFSTPDLRREVLDGIAQGRPRTGPLDVHVDVTNTCNAACISCWDHSPLLHTARPRSWKRHRIDKARFLSLVDELAALGSVRHFVISGMGEPLTHPDIYELIAAVKAQGWRLTVISNLVAANVERLAKSGVDRMLVGVHGATPATYAAFHPGWTEAEFFRLCRHLRALRRAGVSTRHVHVITRETAPEVVQMVAFGRLFDADRVNFKLASLTGGTEACGIGAAQRDWLLAEGIPAARAAAADQGVPTNLDLFEAQVRAAESDLRTTTPMEEVGCFMGYVYTRITVDLDVLYCCNTNVRVGSLQDGSFGDLWTGPAWQGLRDRARAGALWPGCERCGKFEQNVAWSARFEEHAGHAAWQQATGNG
jgi:MoaA/NifB/PqqE/SkfB family radical SAM enzyme